MAIVKDLTYFKLGEFKHPELVNPLAAARLDEVRRRFGKPLVLTDDARAAGEMPPGASVTSLHFKGQALDLRIRDFTAQDLWSLVHAVVSMGVGIELELVWSSTDKHCHIGFWLDDRPSTFILSLE